MGGQELAIDPFFVRYLAMQGIDFYGDPEVGKWLQKRHEEFRVKSGGTRLQVGYTGVSGAATRKRSSKTFPAAAPAAGESKRSEQRNKQT
jgi:hypothetical protein